MRPFISRLRPVTGVAAVAAFVAAFVVFSTSPALSEWHGGGGDRHGGGGWHGRGGPVWHGRSWGYHPGYRWSYHNGAWGWWPLAVLGGLAVGSALAAPYYAPPPTPYAPPPPYAPPSYYSAPPSPYGYSGY